MYDNVHIICFTFEFALSVLCLLFTASNYPFRMFKLFIHLRLFVFALNTGEDQLSHTSSWTFAYENTVYYYSIFQFSYK